MLLSLSQKLLLCICDAVNFINISEHFWTYYGIAAKLTIAEFACEICLNVSGLFLCHCFFKSI